MCNILQVAWCSYEHGSVYGGGADIRPEGGTHGLVYGGVHTRLPRAWLGSVYGGGAHIRPEGGAHTRLHGSVC